VLNADIETAVSAAAFSAFYHQGEICMSTDRVIVAEAIAEELAARLARKADSLIAGDPNEPSTQIGPLINDDQVRRVHAHVQDAVDKGARLGRRHLGRSRLPPDRAHRRHVGDADLRRETSVRPRR
jgi:acyl-CoA reductase-like NAD-dependent aldehyde dehydrogenase